VTSGWLVRDGAVLAPAEIAHGPVARARGLLGRDALDGVLVLRPCRSVHTFGMRFPIDVVFCDRAGCVLRTVTLRRGRISPVVWRSAMVIEAGAGACADWEVRVGDRLEVRT
jgi:uncharacterized membrane protein (UPF0127 family)